MVLGINYEEQMKLLEIETRLLSNSNVVEDAKGKILYFVLNL